MLDDHDSRDKNESGAHFLYPHSSFCGFGATPLPRRGLCPVLRPLSHLQTGQEGEKGREEEEEKSGSEQRRRAFVVLFLLSPARSHGADRDLQVTSPMISECGKRVLRQRVLWKYVYLFIGLQL